MRWRKNAKSTCLLLQSILAWLLNSIYLPWQWVYVLCCLWNFYIFDAAVNLSMTIEFHLLAKGMLQLKYPWLLNDAEKECKEYIFAAAVTLGMTIEFYLHAMGMLQLKLAWLLNDAEKECKEYMFAPVVNLGMTIELYLLAMRILQSKLAWLLMIQKKSAKSICLMLQSL